MSSRRQKRTNAAKEEVPEDAGGSGEEEQAEYDDEENEQPEAIADMEAEEEDWTEEEGEEEQEREAVEDGGVFAGGFYNPTDVNGEVFEELRLPQGMVAEVVRTWEQFLKSCGSRDAAAEALFASVYEATLSWQHLFKMPRAVFAIRFMNGVQALVSALNDPAMLKLCVETMSFQHLEIEISAPRVAIFRDAILDLFGTEMGAAFSSVGRDGWGVLLNYAGGAMIYVRMKYSDRLMTIQSSWAAAKHQAGTDGHSERGRDSSDEREGPSSKTRAKHRSGSQKKHAGESDHASGTSDMSDDNFSKNNTVPRTFNEMFMFNATVMGFGEKVWMKEVLSSFDDIVCYVSSANRLQEECDVISLRLAKHKAPIDLSMFKAVMLASMRALVPTDWNGAHEVAWSWLWENVERLLKASMGKPPLFEKAVAKFNNSLDEDTKDELRVGVYSTLFSTAPRAEDYFKQSISRLHSITDRIFAMTYEILHDPERAVDDITAVGLRHVGYGIPIDMIGPFVTSYCQVVSLHTLDEMAREGFGWALGLIARILTRVITEGSTIVMKAINNNSAKQLRKAVSCAPRGWRASWMLSVQTGKQSISPLMLAIKSSALDAARAMIVDLLTIRADRDRYYYGMDTMFERHPDIVKRLVQDAPALLYTIFDGLIWRSRTTENGVRRVNYYVKHLMVDSKGEFARTIEWLTENGDPKIVCHPVVAMVTDLIWGRVAFRAFLYGKAWEIFSLLMFIIGVAFFGNPARHDEAQRIVIMSCRLFTYLFSLCPRIFKHVKRTCQNYKQHQTITFHHIPLPTYLLKWQDIVCLFLTIALILMLVFEPILACLGQDGDYEGAGMFTQACDKGTDMRFTYSVMCVFAMFFYFLLTIDLSVFSTRVSAWVLIVFRVVNEVWLYVSGMSFVILAFSCAIAALKHNNEDFNTIPQAALSLLEVSLMIFDGSKYSRMDEEPAVLVIVVLYLLTAVTFLLNLLIAQMNCAYKCVYEDMLGYARLNRGKIVTESMTSVAKWRWSRFVDSLKLDEPCEFGEGDIGLSGAIQVVEPASQNITTVDMIRRFGGSTSPSAQWPEEEGADLETDRFSHIERMLEKAIRRMTPSKGKVAGGSSSSGQNVGSGGYDASGGSARSKDNASEAASEN
uniref:Globin family profile domain-containing protein n=1 Tax=Alexandrium monilatum TaxID=311494 RepID=A0A7S4RUY4_9DINO